MDRIREIISNYGQLTFKYPDKSNLVVGETTFISASQYDDFAKAIQEYIDKEYINKIAGAKYCVEQEKKFHEILKSEKIALLEGLKYNPPESNAYPSLAELLNQRITKKQEEIKGE